MKLKRWVKTLAFEGQFLQPYLFLQPIDRGPYTINNVPLPNAESYVTDAVTPVNLSVALGYAAHSVLMCATILDIPLRNPIVYEGSRSKIVDAIKLLPPNDKE
jgi:UV radiation resistance-associated gene protein